VQELISDCEDTLAPKQSSEINRDVKNRLCAHLFNTLKYPTRLIVAIHVGFFCTHLFNTGKHPTRLIVAIQVGFFAPISLRLGTSYQTHRSDSCRNFFTHLFHGRHLLCVKILGADGPRVKILGADGPHVKILGKEAPGVKKVGLYPRFTHRRFI
jgi:hypothetical protein